LPLAWKPWWRLRQFKGGAQRLLPCSSPCPVSPQYSRCILVAFVLATLSLAVVLLNLFCFPVFGSNRLGEGKAAPSLDNTCSDPCSIVLVESIPQDMTYDDNSTANPSIFQAWMDLIGDARSSLDIVAFYWTLTNEDTHTQDPSAGQGEQILEELLKLPMSGVSVRIAVNPPSAKQPLSDLQALEQSGESVAPSTGVSSTRIPDQEQPVLCAGRDGTSPLLWLQVKELGAVVYNCSCLAQDLGKMFEAYWVLGVPDASIPSPWPANFSTTFNSETPLELKLNGTDAGVYLSSAPPALCADGRTKDLQALLSVIDGARKFVYVAVMSYIPTMEFSHPKRYWPAIDDHLRKVAYERRVHVRLLIGCWKHSKPSMFPFLRSLAAMQDNRTHYSLEVRLFVVPANETQAKIPFARVNHNKYMVTDKLAYIGTSNWSGDYFVHTAGSALVVNQTGPEAGGAPTLREQLQAVFERDWDSRYSRDVSSLGQGRDLCGVH
uniref:5'-3' exonuclease PLD3 n=1 Tax=Sphenodon punctatus TaxID=8508 RepID=A0A8D0HPY0_SPHPU